MQVADLRDEFPFNLPVARYSMGYGQTTVLISPK